jgi:intein/homing endonuclease
MADADDVPAESNGGLVGSVAAPSKLNKDLQLRVFKQWFLADSAHSAVWRRNAKDDFAFKSGHQWTSEEKAQLESQLRPEIVFNRTITLIKAVAGFEINGRHEIQYLPRNNTDTAVNEVLTAAGKWMGDECEAEDEESDAFQDMSICGMGWCLSDDAMVRLPNTHFATTRIYSGNVIKIDLENGKQLTGTPNHPVLTNAGWKRLCDLREGDNLVCSAFLKGVKGFPIEQFDKVETRLKNKIDAFSNGREALRFATAPNDFYGDGAGSKIHVVYADRFLSDQLRNASRSQQAIQTKFVWRNFLAEVGATLFRDGMSLHAMGTSKGQFALGISHSPSAKIASFYRLAKVMARRAKTFANRFSADADAFTNFIRGKIFNKIKSDKFCQRSLRNGAAPSLSQTETTANQSCGHGSHRYSDLIADFRDWKPLLEIEASKLSGGHFTPSEFMTRVVSRVVNRVENFAVHDVGTSLGMFIAGDVVTSNTENRMCYEEDTKGKYVEEKLPPLEMYWDYNARRKNLKDSRRRARLRQMPLADAREEFPGFDDRELDAAWAIGNDPEDEEKTREQKRIRDENQPTNFDERADVHVLQYQWWEREPYFLVADPIENKKIEMPPDKFRKLEARMKLLGMKLTAIKMKRRVFKQAFIGSVVLDMGDGPAPDQFTLKCMTGEPDEKHGVFFGLIRIMRDPQKWANKWLSQTLHIMNSNAKGGIMVEPDFFEDQRKGEESYAQPNGVTVVKKGGLSGQNPKWVKKPTTEFPAGFYQLLEFAVSSLRDVTGINLELLGQRDINQPGILEAMRKQAGMTVLATLFDSLRRFRKEVGKIRLYFLQNFLNDGRLVRVIGPEGAKALPLLRDKTLGEYDVHIDDAPTSPNQKQANWAVIAPIIPMFKDELSQHPELLVALLEYSPLPSRLVDTLKALVAKPNPDQQQNKQLAIAKLVSEISKNQSTAEMQNKKAAATEATSLYDLALAQKMLLDTPMEHALKGAQVAHQAAQTENVQAATHGQHAKTAHTHVDALIKALTPIEHGPPSEYAPAQPPEQNVAA